MAQSMAALARAVGPAFGGALWSLSERLRFVPLCFLVVVVANVLTWLLSRRLPVELELSTTTVARTVCHPGDELLEGRRPRRVETVELEMAMEEQEQATVSVAAVSPIVEGKLLLGSVARDQNGFR